jgi:hypothetical protein
MVRNTSRKQYDALMQDPRILNLEDPAYWDAMAAVRKASDLPPLHFTPSPANFSGSWALDEDRSALGPMGAGFAPARIEVVQQGNDLTIRTTRILEYADDQVTEEKLTLDGAESKTTFMNSPRVTTARMSADGSSLEMNSTISLVWGPPGTKLVVKDAWSLSGHGDFLTVHRTTSGFRGEQKLVLVFARR